MHLPLSSPTLHDSHVPLHADSQHTPSEQKPLLHSVVVVHVAPLLPGPLPASLVVSGPTSKSPSSEVQPVNAATVAPTAAANAKVKSEVLRCMVGPRSSERSEGSSVLLSRGLPRSRALGHSAAAATATATGPGLLFPTRLARFIDVLPTETAISCFTRLNKLSCT
jgi:hypothetical protein